MQHVSITEVNAGILYKWYQYQKPETDQAEIETEITHFIGYKLCDDLEERGSRGGAKKL